MNEAVCDTYYKGFEEFKKKVMWAFHLFDLKDIFANEPEGAEEEGVIDVQGKMIEFGDGTGSEIDIEPF